MLSGFNTNFRYRGVLFHVQTEDSGLDNPHVISHLFHGGNIMASEKRDYSELVAELADQALEDAVRKLMETQHKEMLKALSRGAHDVSIEQRMGPDVFRVETTESDSTVPPSITEEQPALADAPPTAASPPAREAEPTVLEPFESPAPPDGGGDSRLSRVFGDRVVSEKPLDEVVLDYLVENARKRKRGPK